MRLGQADGGPEPSLAPAPPGSRLFGLIAQICGKPRKPQGLDRFRPTSPQHRNMFMKTHKRYAIAHKQRVMIIIRPVTILLLTCVCRARDCQSPPDDTSARIGAPLPVDLSDMCAAGFVGVPEAELTTQKQSGVNALDVYGGARMALDI